MAGVWKGALLKSGGAYAGQSANPVMDLYRRACKEVPRVMTIYDIDMDSAVVSTNSTAWHWRSAPTHLPLSDMDPMCCKNQCVASEASKAVVDDLTDVSSTFVDVIIAGAPQDR